MLRYKKTRDLESRVFAFVAIINTNHQRKNFHNKNLKHFYYIDGGRFSLLHRFLYLTFFWVKLFYEPQKFKELRYMKKTLVLGASLKPNRYSNMAINRLVTFNHEVEAIGLRKGVVAGIEISTEKIPFENIHTVTLYLNPQRQEAYYDYIISLKPKRVIFNPGTENPAFYKMLQQQNIEVEVACTLVLLGTNQY